MFLCDNLRCLAASDNIHDTYVVSSPGVCIKQCTACKQSNYCSKQCQREAIANGHKFSCQPMLAQAAGTRSTRLKMFRGIQKRFEAAMLLDKKNKTTELRALQDSMLADADALLTSTGNEYVIFRIYDMLARVHQTTKNVHEFHRFNLMTKYISDRMDSSILARLHKTSAYISVGQSSLVIGEALQSIALHTKCLKFCLDYPNEQRHLWTKIAHGSLELGKYQACIDQVQHAVAIPVSTLAIVSPNLPPIEVEIASQLLLLAQSNLALGNYKSALRFHKLLWHYSTVKKLHEYVFMGHSGIATAMCARAAQNLAEAREYATLAPLEMTVNLQYTGHLPCFATSLKRARVWYMKGDSIDNGGLYASTFLRLAFLEYNLTKHYHAILTQPISQQTEQPDDLIFAHMRTIHNKYLVKFLEQQIEVGNRSCSFCEQSRFANDRLLMCSGCSVVRFCNRQHQELASKKMSTISGRFSIRHHSVCKLLGCYVMYLVDKSVENTQLYLKEQLVFFERGL